jgi:hypothetical protein
VAPIITYQVEKQRAEALPVAMGETSGSEIATRFTTEAIAWWTPRVRDYARIIELIRTREDAGLEVSFELIEAPEDAGSGTWKADVLVVAAKHPREEDEVIRVEVNDRAMTLAHFLQRQINQGFFEEVDPEARERIETAVANYARLHVLPQIPPLHVRADMSLDEIADEISHHQDDRIRAARQVPALVEIIENAARGGSAS